MNKRNLRLLIGLFISLSIGGGRSVFAQPAAEPLGAGPANFGLQDAVVEDIGWEDILPAVSSSPHTVMFLNSTAYRTSSEFFGSRVSLGRIPHGAKLLGFNIYYYDDSPDGSLEVTYCRDYVDSATGQPKGSECPVSFFSEGQPLAALGNLLVPADLQTVLLLDDIDADGSPETVHHSLHLILGPNIGVHSIRPQWLRQVSPAPSVATFNDVPSSDGAFQFIEAMAASGVTVGCDPGPPPRYCPDSFVTRRQMAVFFAKALGLHWSPF